MRKTYLLRLMLCLLLSALLLCGCKSAAPAATDTPLFELNDTLRAMDARIKADPPVAISYTFHGEGDGGTSPLYGADAVEALYAALSAIRITGTTDVTATDSDVIYAFLYADGSKDTILFNYGNLESEGQRYTVTGRDGLGDLDFPAMGRYRSLTETHPDASVRAFDAAFYDAPPVSVTFTAEGAAPQTTGDAEAVEAAFSYLSSAELLFCTADGPSFGPEGDGDRPMRTLTFAMADGSEYRFEFAGTNLVVEFPAPVGTQYYWLDNTADALFALFPA